VNAPDDPLTPYLTHLLDARDRARAAYDKAVLALSGGALALSFVYIRDVVGDDGPIVAGNVLVWSWISFAVSIAAILGAMLTSQEALRVTIRRVYDKKLPALEGGWHAIVTNLLRVLAAASFVLGVVLLALVVRQNIGEEETGDEYATLVRELPHGSAHAYAAPHRSERRDEAPILRIDQTLDGRSRGGVSVR
jgi:hypothetical protein